jgi:hypothetical protein
VLLPVKSAAVDSPPGDAVGANVTARLAAYSAILLGIALVSTATSASGASVPAPGEVSLSGAGFSTNDVPPYIDAQDGIQTKGIAWNADPALWPHTATVALKGSAQGQQEARVKLRIEGKGDPVSQSGPQQTCLLMDDSGSMSSNDPNNIRFDGGKTYIDQLTAPDEVCVVFFPKGSPPAQPAEVIQGLTTNYQSARGAMVHCQGSGSCSLSGTPMFDAFRVGNDELIPKKKTGFSWVHILLTDGCWNTGGDPQPEVDRAVAAGLRIFAIGLFPNGGGGCDQDLIDWAAQGNGKYYHVTNPNDLIQVYQEIAKAIKSDVAGKKPASGAPMITFKMTNDIEVVPNSFVCDSPLCTMPTPSNNPSIVPNNKGLKLEWNNPADVVRIKQYWQVEFGVRSYVAGTQIKVNDVAQSFVEYDRYDGTPGGSDVFEQVYVNVNNDIPGVGGAGLGEPPQPPPPPPHGGIPQLIPQPQQVPITYIQNLPVLHGVTQVQGIPLQYLLGSAMGMAVADRVKMKSRIKQGVKIAMASM